MRTLDLQHLISETQKAKLKTRLKALLAPAGAHHKFVVILTVSVSALCVGIMVPRAVDGIGFFAPLVISTGLCALVTLHADWPRSCWRLTRKATALLEAAGRKPDDDGSAVWSAAAAAAAEDRHAEHENWQVDLMAESAWNDHFGQYATWHYEAVER
ncbi:uncharacterized protein LOC116267494 [Nymphaea colorata]|uniref:uncharacterized protein LOC116267494 n=1 Tax=Nymphaea colorata TaxID=210225 RepID=UPI00129DF426|nr:uncharacterized protein LOC116267494 [Nymphaea colorata]